MSQAALLDPLHNKPRAAKQPSEQAPRQSKARPTNPKPRSKPRTLRFKTPTTYSIIASYSLNLSPLASSFFLPSALQQSPLHEFLTTLNIHLSFNLPFAAPPIITLTSFPFTLPSHSLCLLFYPPIFQIILISISVNFSFLFIFVSFFYLSFVIINCSHVKLEKFERLKTK